MRKVRGDQDTGKQAVLFARRLLSKRPGSPYTSTPSKEGPESGSRCDDAMASSSLVRFEVAGDTNTLQQGRGKGNASGWGGGGVVSGQPRVPRCPGNYIPPPHTVTPLLQLCASHLWVSEPDDCCAIAESSTLLSSLGML